MKNLNEFSTPIADDAYGEAQDFHASGYVVPLSTARDLERKLAACREFILATAKTSSSSRIRREASQVFTSTAP